MRLSVFFILFTASLNVFSQSGYRKEIEIRESPLNILEYYLIIPGQPYHHWLHKEDDDFTEFEFRKMYLRPMPGMKISIDTKNAFMSIIDNTSELSYQMQICYFKQADGSKIIGIYEDQTGGDCDSRSLIFYRYIHKKFIDVTKNVMPEIILKDFCPMAYNLHYNMFETVYRLPRTGTTIKVKAQPLCGQDERIRMGSVKYYEYFNKLKCNLLELTWNKRTGTFTIRN